MHTRNLALGAAVAALALLAAACGGGGGNDSGGTATPTYVPAGTPLPTPLVTGTHVESSAVGYAFDFPSGWTFRPNFLTTPDSHVDAAFEPSSGGPVQANISVRCQSSAETPTTDALRDQELRIVQSLATGNVTQEVTEVAGQQAHVLRFTRRISKEGDPFVALDQTEVVFVSPRCGWAIILVTPQGQTPTYQPMLDAALRSFRLL